MRFIRAHRAWWLLAGLALAVRLLYLLKISGTPFYYPSQLDPLFYYNWGREIAAGNWIGEKIFIQSPLYAYLLAIFLKTFGDRVFPILFFQVLIGVGTCLLTARIGHRLLGRKEGWVAGIVAALYGPFLFYEGMVMKTFLSTFLTVLLVDLLIRSDGVRRKLLILSGFVFALTSLVRDNFVLLTPLVLAGIFFAFPATPLRQRLKGCLLFTLGAAAGILPVTARNYAVGHEFALLTTGGGEVFYIGNNADANGRYLPPPFVRADPRQEHDDFIAKASELSGRKLSPGESSNFWLRQGLDWIRRDPLAWLRLLLRKLIIFWNAYELPDNYNYYEVRHVLLSPFSLAGALLYVPLRVVTFALLAPLGLTGIFLTRRRWRALLLVHLVLFGYMGTVLLFFNFSRFRVPVVPLLCLFAGPPLVGLFREVRSFVAAEGAPLLPGAWERIRRTPTLLIPPLLFLALWVVVNFVGTGGRGVFPALQYHLSLGDTYRSQSRYADAEREYRLGLQILGDEPMDAASAAALGIDPARMRQEVESERMAQGVNFNAVRSGLHYGLGALWIQQGQEWLARDRAKGEDLIRRGVRVVEDAVKAVPYPPHLSRLAEAYSLLGRPADAEKTYRRALTLWPDDFGLHYDLAGLFFQEGRYPAALEEMHRAKDVRPRLEPWEVADYHYGMALLRLDGYRERGKALYHLRKALDANPDHPERQRIEEMTSDLVRSGIQPEPED